MTAKNFFNELQKAQIIESIKKAEENTSGEIRLHMQDSCKNEDPLEEAIKIFHQLKMNKTELHNGVLFFVAVKNKKFAVYADKGINEKVPSNFWNDIKDLVINHFKEEKFVEGLSQGILLTGDKLKQYFPFKKDDQNELSNEISY